jgi:hypothetical protein
MRDDHEAGGYHAVNLSQFEFQDEAIRNPAYYPSAPMFSRSSCYDSKVYQPVKKY